MKIRGVEVWPVTMRLREPYQLAYGAFECATNIFLKITTDDELTGYGCAAPDEHVTGESPADILKAIREVIEPSIRGRDPLRIALLLEELRPSLLHQPTARAALDMALHDLLGKKCGLPVWKLLGGYRECIKTSVTVGILPETDTVRRAQEWVRQGFQCLKLKGGLDVDSDVARVLKVREAVGEGVQLRFDANGGYDAEQSIHFIDRTRLARLELFEQPTPKCEPELMARVTREVPVPVMADESLLTLRDAFQLARDQIVDMVNVKLMKVGGIADALQINGVARAAGFEVMVGCMDESALGIAAGLHFALARPNVGYADLDGHIGLENDPAASAVRIDRGVLYPHDGPGFGLNRLLRS